MSKDFRTYKKIFVDDVDARSKRLLVTTLIIVCVWATLRGSHGIPVSVHQSQSCLETVAQPSGQQLASTPVA